MNSVSSLIITSFRLSEVNPSQICLSVVITIVEDELDAITAVKCPVLALVLFLDRREHPYYADPKVIGPRW